MTTDRPMPAEACTEIGSDTGASGPGFDWGMTVAAAIFVLTWLGALAIFPWSF